MRTPFPFPVVVVTAPTERSAQAYQEELQARLSKRYCVASSSSCNDEAERDLILLAVADPRGKRVGSGGGTLNALAHVQAYLRKHGNNNMPSVLMVHSGGDSQRSPTNSVCGKAWSCLNALREDDGGSNAPMDLLLEQFLHLFAGGVPAGSLVVASSDVLLILPSLVLDWNAQQGVVGLATRVPAALGPNHGVYVTAAKEEEEVVVGGCQEVTRYMQKASLEQLEEYGAISSPEGEVLLDTGAIYFSPEVTRELVRLPEENAVFRRCCTWEEGKEGREEALRLELYSDMLLALSEGLGQSRGEYLRMDGCKDDAALREAREVLWSKLSPYKFSALVPPGGLFGHLGTTKELMEMMTMDNEKMLPFTEAFRLARRVCCVVVGEGEGQEGREEGAVVLNSILKVEGGVSLGKGAVVEHCFVRGEGRMEVGEGALVSGLGSTCSACSVVEVGPGVIVQEVRLGLKEEKEGVSSFPSSSSSSSSSSYVMSVLSIEDNIKATYGGKEAGVWGQPWENVLDMLQVDAEVIWPSNSSSSSSSSSKEEKQMPRTLWHARLFPAVSGEEAATAAAKTAAGAWGWQQAYAGKGVLPSKEEVEAWREARRLSLCDILAEAEPRAEFRWRRALEKKVLTVKEQGKVQEKEGGKVGGEKEKEEQQQQQQQQQQQHQQQQQQLQQCTQVLAALQEALWTGPSLEVSDRESIDKVWQNGLSTRGEREWLVGALEEWVEGQVLSSSSNSSSSSSSSSSSDFDLEGAGVLSVVASTYALLARVLRELAREEEGREGLREDRGEDEAPSTYDARWTQAVKLLVQGTKGGGEREGGRGEAIRQLRALRAAWTNQGGEEGREGGKEGSRSLLRHAAAHCDMTTFALIKKQVASVQAAVVFKSVPRVGVGMSVVAEAPARIDLSGGWSDTPPISYELGGEVTNLAIQLNGQRPIGARVEVLKEGVVVLQARQANGMLTQKVCWTIRDLEEEEEEGEEGGGDEGKEGGKKAVACPTALVRWCLKYCGVLPLLESTAAAAAPAAAGKAHASPKNNHHNNQQDAGEDDRTSSPHLATVKLELPALLSLHVGGGLRIETWSALPTGSGLGTSSILVGTVLAALGRACGRAYSLRALNHAVLEVEQLMGVGGGWQDQVGGLVGGAKRAFSPPGLPLEVDYQPLALSPGVRDVWERHLLLVYTGKQRLAKHLVRSVVMGYYAQSPEVLTTLQGLILGARAAAVALTQGDVVGLGRCVNRYRQQKRVMAPSCEPEHVRRLMKALESRVVGMALCGAGGGGFLVLVTKRGEDMEGVQEVVEEQCVDAYVAMVVVDEEGLSVRVEEAGAGMGGVGGA